MFATSIPSPNWSGFTVGPFEIRAYALCILLGMIVAVWMTNTRLTKRGAEPGIVIDIVLWAIPLGIIGARIYHVLTHPEDYFGPGKDLWDTVKIWDGGIAIFGSLIGGGIGAYIGTRRAGIRFLSFADAAAPGILLAQAIGRWGNWFNQELYGKPTTLPWGLQIDPNVSTAFPQGLPATTLFHPTFLYESLWDVVGVLLLLWIGKRFRTQWGQLFALYLIWYSIGRTWLETLRIDPIDVFLGIRTNQWAAMIVVVLGVAFFILQARRHPGAEPSIYLPGREPEVDSESSEDDPEDDSEATDDAGANSAGQ